MEAWQAGSTADHTSRTPPRQQMQPELLLVHFYFLLHLSPTNVTNTRQFRKQITTSIKEWSMSHSRALWYSQIHADTIGFNCSL